MWQALALKSPIEWEWLQHTLKAYEEGRPESSLLQALKYLLPYRVQQSKEASEGARSLERPKVIQMQGVVGKRHLNNKASDSKYVRECHRCE